MYDNVYEILAADTLRAFADTTMLDLSIAPMVIGAPVESNMIGLVARVAEGAGYDCHHFSCRDADAQARKDLESALSGNKPLIIAVTAEDALDRPTFDGIVQSLQDDATINVIVLVYGRYEQLDAMLSAVENSMSVHPALVPTVTAVTNASDRRHQIIGHAHLTDSKCGLRFLTIDVSEPYDHEVRVTVQGTPEQDDDMLNSALWDVLEHPGEIALQARVKDGYLVCGTADMTAL